MSTLTDVLDYAARGWQVFPLKPQSKEPATRRGFYDATTNPATLQRWFANFPYNVGIRTGAPSNIFVLDIDGDAGFAGLSDIESVQGRLPPTLLSSTGNGRHYWFVAQDPIPCSAAKIGPAIDVKADGGYVAAPPSIHPNGKIYRWIDASIVPTHAPDWLLRLARTPKPLPISERACALIRRPSSNGPSAYGQAALDDEIEALAAAAPGSRNQALNRAAFRLSQLVAGGELDRTHVVDSLIDASHRNGLIKDDGLRSIQATIRSGMAAGLQYPRSRSGAA